MKRDPGCTRFLVLAIALAGLVLFHPLAGGDAWARESAPALECPPCDDGNACTIDSCDTSTGICRHDPRSCDDGNPCTVDSCVPNPPSGAAGCFNVALGDGTTCDDGNACTEQDACSAGQCIGTPMHNNSECNDGNACTARDRCTASGTCVGEPALPGTACDDGSACTTGDVCVAPTAGAGVVCRGEAVDCDDNDPCTVDTCDPATGACSNTPVDCSDGNVCTTDACDSAAGACQHTPAAEPCDDGDPCTLFDMCNAGNCVPGSPKNCDDGNPCTTDSCDPATGACVHAPASGPCDDGNRCTTGDACAGGTCAGTPVNCDDANACTADSCDPATGACVHAPASGPCDDGNACTTGDACAGGACVGTPVNCDDSEVCTIDSCDPATGACLHTPTNAPCNDGNACTTGETCATGTCGGGTPVTCGASSECFDNVCDPAVGCVVQPRIGAPCNGGNLCFTGTCSAGGCQVQTFLCDDHNVCTIDSCQDQATGACGHASVSCDDGRSCTIDSCNPSTGCQHAFDANLPDTDLDGLPDSCDNCPTTANHFQDDCNGNGIGDSCDPSLFDLRIRTQSSLGKGSGEVIWSTVCEVDMRGFNVVMIDSQGGRTRLNPVLIPCSECINGLSSSYSTFIPKHKSARNIFLEVVHRTSAILTVGPAVRE